MLKSPILRFCHVEVVGDEKKFSHASYQCNVGVVVVIGNKMLVERLCALIVLGPVHTSQVQDLSEERVSCSADFSSALEGRT
jgi:hypothetical protein